MSNLREFLLRGGTLTFDDFHGPIEWDNLEKEMKRVFPDRKIVDLPATHPIYSCFYQIDSFPQTPGLGSFLQGRTWEKGGFEAKLRAIQDDNGRAMVLINWNTDMGDGWEWSNVADYPGYVRFTAQAYRMQINEIVYSLHALMHTTQTDIAAVAERVAAGRERILAEIRKVIVGQDTVIEQVLMALFTGGHCLITGVPGLAKTLLDQDASRRSSICRSSASSSRRT